MFINLSLDRTKTENSLRAYTLQNYLGTPPIPFLVRLSFNNSLTSQQLKFLLNHKLGDRASYAMKANNSSSSNNGKVL